jgi:hypothetical protein
MLNRSRKLGNCPKSENNQTLMPYLGNYFWSEIVAYIPSSVWKTMGDSVKESVEVLQGALACSYSIFLLIFQKAIKTLLLRSKPARMRSAGKGGLSMTIWTPNCLISLHSACC